MKNIMKEINKIFELVNKDPYGQRNKFKKKRLTPENLSFLEGEYTRCTQSNGMWAKRDQKRIAKALSCDVSKIYKWCWEHKNKQEKI